MRIWMNAGLAILGFGIAIFAGTAGADAQQQPQRIILKSGETVELGNVLFVANCQSIMIGTPVIEVLEGPEEVTLAIKEGKVVPRGGDCTNPVAGGTVMATAKDVKEKKEARLTYRVMYKTKDGDRPRGFVYLLSLFPQLRPSMHPAFYAESS
jgi:hypothetical protein